METGSSAPANPKPEERRFTAAFDFDGVIAKYDGWKGVGVFGEPILEVISTMNWLRRHDWKIIIYTTRGIHEIEGFLKEHEVPFDEINRNIDIDTLGTKPVADVYIDDRAILYHGQDRYVLIDDIREFLDKVGRA